MLCGGVFADNQNEHGIQNTAEGRGARVEKHDGGRAPVDGVSGWWYAYHLRLEGHRDSGGEPPRAAPPAAATRPRRPPA